MSDTANTSSNEGTGIAEAASILEKMWAPEQDKPAPDKSKAAEDDTEVADEGVEDGEQQEAETGSETQGEIPEDADDAEAETDEENSEAADQPISKVTVTIDGKTEELPLDEVVKGYQRQADYSRKTQALAQERQHFEQDRTAVQQERGAYSTLLTALQQHLQELAPKEPNWDQLFQQDPVEWNRQYAIHQQLKERNQAVREEQARIRQLAQIEQQQADVAFARQEAQRLVEKMPAWKDEKRRAADWSAMQEYGRNLGFSDDELAGTTDHRALMVLHKARLYDAMVAKSKAKPGTTTAPQATAAKAPPVLKPGSANTSSKSTSDLTRAKQRLAKTGSVRDAASVIERLLK